LNNWHYNANDCTVNNKIYFVTKQRSWILCSTRKHKDDSANDGPYFDCMRGRDYFTCLSNLVENLGFALQSSTQEITHSADFLHFKVGDNIRFSRFKIGIIRFIGITEETGTHEILLVLSFVLFLDVNAKDGSIGETALFVVSRVQLFYITKKKNEQLHAFRGRSATNLQYKYLITFS
ncbi:hypothetical protein RFI_37091, partial [Reticulomyxa filosa]